MSDPVPVIVEIRRIKPVKVSTLHAKAERYRDGFVKLFREHEHAELLNDDGSEMLDGAGRRVSLTAGRFAREMGINRSTFHYWLNGRPEPEMGSHSERTDDRTADEGWDLPGVPEEAVEKIRRAVEHNERLYAEMLSRPCPACEAVPGQTCRSPSGRSRGKDGWHPEREAESGPAEPTEPTLSAKIFGDKPALFAGGIARVLNNLADDLNGIKGRVPQRGLDALRTALARVSAQIARLDQS